MGRAVEWCRWEVLVCDEHTLKSEGEGVGVTRRQFSKMTTTTALAMTIPAVANAKTVTAQDVTIETADSSDLARENTQRS